MRTMLNPRRCRYLARVGTVLIAVALIAGTIGCPPPAVQYELTISSTEGGSVTAPGNEALAYDAGTAVDLVAEAEEGYRFVNWTGDVETIHDVNAASTTITMNGNYSITANFVVVHDLTISSTSGGLVTAPGEGTFTYETGVMVDLVAVADECYEFVNWTGDTVGDPGSAATAITVDAAKSVTANFALLRYNLTADSTDGGSVTAPGEGPSTYDCGTTVALVAEADEGYLFARWTGDVDSITDINAASTTITMDDNYAVTADFVAEEAIYFADRNLEAAVRAAIGEHMGPIYPSDVAELTSLSARQKNISDLTGLQQCTSLTVLNLSNNQISDISPLANLTHLEELHLGWNHMSDISPLANLTNLTNLHLWANRISNISALAGLINLTGVYLGGNQISSISPLAGLTGLIDLRLGVNQIQDVSPITELTMLKGLDLGSNQIVNISPLADLTNLTELNVCWNQIVDLSPLANLTSLTDLRACGNRIRSISALGNLTELTWLSLGGNQIGDLSPLANLTNLTGLDLGDNNLGDISSLANLANLTEIRLDTNRISDVSPLANLTHLRRLDLGQNRISDVSPLANLANLTELDLGYNEIDNISPLGALYGLTYLYLHENRLTDVPSLADLTGLIWLSLWGNQIGDVLPLATLTNLTVIELGENEIKDISPLVENEGLSQGDYVDLRWNPLDSASINTHVPQLEARGVKFSPKFPLVETCPCVLDTEWIQNPATGNYYALTVPMSWMAAEGCAQAWGGHLVTLSSWNEETWIKNTFGRSENFWIGFNVIGRERRPDHYIWSSGEPVTYSKWAYGEPNNYRGEDAAVMNWRDGWNDLSRHAHHRAVIEVNEKPG
ncbi:MAG: leucine-rich repeat domain-containing protein [Dehalococcoidia bacterium]